MKEINVGKGQCQGTARLLIKPVQAVVELGAWDDMLMKTLNAVHHLNRHADIGDFVAAAFPVMSKGRSVIRAGHEVELIGSETSLATLLQLDGIQTLKRRGMMIDPEICETYFEAGMTGAAYVRDHACMKHTAGWVRRTKARAERRGKELGRKIKMQPDDVSSLILSYGSTILHVREIVAAFLEAPLMVSTYGFSSPGEPAILPVMPDSARLVADAA